MEMGSLLMAALFSSHDALVTSSTNVKDNQQLVRFSPFPFYFPNSIGSPDICRRAKPPQFPRQLSREVAYREPSSGCCAREAFSFWFLRGCWYSLRPLQWKEIVSMASCPIHSSPSLLGRGRQNAINQYGWQRKVHKSNPQGIRIAVYFP